MKTIWPIYSLLLTAINAQSLCDKASFVDRAGWGGREPTSITNLTRKPFSFYVIHHSYDPPNCYDDTSCIERVKQIQDLHQTTFGWADVGYHFLVGENGKVYEGRGWNRQAAHSPGWNDDAFGICIMGDFRTAPPNEKALNAVRSWIDCGIKHGHVKEDYYIITHRQSQRPGYTECPGNGTMDVVNKWPRYCSFQNPGTPLDANETLLSLANNSCGKEVPSPSSASTYFITPVILFFLLLIYSL
ncbi:unnamed protein product [Rotaria magnacalcarata]|uniref:Peptidoglycan-recognition protein n=6 Tax=Rotaria magnacalcarata TaxID=392030 RepID=A0A816EAD1_9BILA|nr:unnamed protein product [Rotaria magnacalcarata]